MDTVYKLLRTVLKVFPKLSTNQFLCIGFVDVKSKLMSEVISAVLKFKSTMENEQKKLKKSSVKLNLSNMAVKKSTVVKNYSESNMNTIYNETSNENTFNTATFKPKTVVNHHSIPLSYTNNLPNNHQIASSGTNNVPGFYSPIPKVGGLFDSKEQVLSSIADIKSN